MLLAEPRLQVAELRGAAAAAERIDGVLGEGEGVGGGARVRGLVGGELLLRLERAELRLDQPILEGLELAVGAVDEVAALGLLDEAAVRPQI